MAGWYCVWKGGIINFKMTVMKILFTTLLLSACTTVFAQKQTFDIATYTAPKGWTKQATADAVVLMKEDASGTYCLITLYKSLTADGNSKGNFDAAWQALVKEQLDVEGAPEMQPVANEEGWEVQSGYGTFEKDGAKGIALLVSSTGYTKLVNILILTNTDAYEKDMTAFLESIDLKKTTTGNTGKNTNTAGNTSDPVKPAANNTSAPPVKSKFKFNTTNFDDGWMSTEQEDWVEVTKGNMKVLLHYPKEGTIFPADPDVLTAAAWNILVAPRYNDIQNYITTSITSYDRPYLGAATLTDKKTGQQVYVVLFRKGDSGWVEFIAPDKSTFIKNFTADIDAIKWDSDIGVLNAMIKMPSYNKFAIAAADFSGSWTSDFTGLQQLYNVYTGASGGMLVNQSHERFDFAAGNSYNWKLLVVNGTVGAMNYAQVKSAGKFSIPNNWQIHFTKIESGPKTYNAHFSCIKGARILWLQDAKYPNSYTQYGKIE